MDIASKVEQMRRGYAVLLSVDELDAIEKEYSVRTAHNADAIGTRSAPYVGWMSGSLSTSPPDLRINSNSMRASARAGRCVYSKSRRSLPDAYYVTDEYAK